MSTDKYPSIFLRQMEAILYIFLRQMGELFCVLKNWFVFKCLKIRSNNNSVGHSPEFSVTAWSQIEYPRIWIKLKGMRGNVKKSQSNALFVQTF